MDVSANVAMGCCGIAQQPDPMWSHAATLHAAGHGHAGWQEQTASLLMVNQPNYAISSMLIHLEQPSQRQSPCP